MIKISKPRIEEREDQSYLISHIIDEKQKIDCDFFYSVDLEYGQYLADEVADAFVVGCLLPAALYDEDIVVECAMSEKLYYNLTNTVLYILATLFDCKIKIRAKELTNTNYNAQGVGCGCSLGVDSLAAIFQHSASFCSNGYEAAPASYNITHLTYFNVGAMGYVDLAKAKTSYDKDIQLVKAFASEIGLPVISLESNFSILYKDFDFDASGDMRNFSAALSLQKLFGKYLYGSGYPVTEYKYDREQTGYYEFLLAPMVSTESMEIVIANPNMSRVDKTKFIVDNPLTQKYLYVCWKELIANRWPDSEIARIKDKKLNCSHCDKCKRTLLAIDILGKLPLFEKNFDIPYWESVKNKYIAQVIYNKDNNVFYKELYLLMQEYHYNITPQINKELSNLKFRETIIWRAAHKVNKIMRKKNSRLM